MSLFGLNPERSEVWNVADRCCVEGDSSSSGPFLGLPMHPAFDCLRLSGSEGGSEQPAWFLFLDSESHAWGRGYLRKKHCSTCFPAVWV